MENQTRTGLLYHTIRVELLRRGMKMADLAECLGCTPQAIADRLKEPVTTKTVEIYANVFGQHATWLETRCHEEWLLAKQQGVDIEPLQLTGVYTPRMEEGHGKDERAD